MIYEMKLVVKPFCSKLDLSAYSKDYQNKFPRKYQINIQKNAKMTLLNDYQKDYPKKCLNDYTD